MPEHDRRNREAQGHGQPVRDGRWACPLTHLPHDRQAMSLYPTPQTLMTKSSPGARSSFCRNRETCESSVRVLVNERYPQTSRSSSSFVNTRLRLGRERDEQLELLPGEMDGLAAHGHDTRRAGRSRGRRPRSGPGTVGTSVAAPLGCGPAARRRRRGAAGSRPRRAGTRAPGRRRPPPPGRARSPGHRGSRSGPARPRAGARRGRARSRRRGRDVSARRARAPRRRTRPAAHGSRHSPVVARGIPCVAGSGSASSSAAVMLRN